MSTISNYFVYVLLDLRKQGEFIYEDYRFKNEPFYIGVSHRKERLNEHFWKSQENTFKQAVIRKILKEGCLRENITLIMLKDLSKEEAFNKEKEIIGKIGRRDQKLGPLTNLSSGGEGTLELTQEQKQQLKDYNILNSRFKGKKHTKESKEKMRKTIGDKRKGELNANYGKRWTKEQKEQASINQKENLKHLRGDNNPSKRKEVKEKLRETKLGKLNPNYKEWELLTPEGTKTIIEGGYKLKERLKEMGFTKAMFYKKENNYRIQKDGWKLKSI